MGSFSLLSAAARRLEGKVALITGGSSGIGESTARLFSKHGAKVVIADIQDELGHSICEELNPQSTSFVHCDVTKEIDVENAVNHAVSKYGAFLGIKHAARVMIPAKKGSIINTASVCSTIGGAGPHGYTSSKHGQVGLMRNTAVELGQFGIRVNCVSPYFVATPLAKKYFKPDDDGVYRVYSNLKGEVLQPEDIAKAVLYLGSDESKYVSGQNIVIDGGFTIVNPGLCMFA